MEFRRVVSNPRPSPQTHYRVFPSEAQAEISMQQKPRPSSRPPLYYTDDGTVSGRPTVTNSRTGFLEFGAESHIGDHKRRKEHHRPTHSYRQLILGQQPSAMEQKELDEETAYLNKQEHQDLEAHKRHNFVPPNRYVQRKNDSMDIGRQRLREKAHGRAAKDPAIHGESAEEQAKYVDHEDRPEFNSAASSFKHYDKTKSTINLYEGGGEDCSGSKEYEVYLKEKGIDRVNEKVARKAEYLKSCAGHRAEQDRARGKDRNWLHMHQASAGADDEFKLDRMQISVTNRVRGTASQDKVGYKQSQLNRGEGPARFGRTGRSFSSYGREAERTIDDNYNLLGGKDVAGLNLRSRQSGFKLYDRENHNKMLNWNPHSGRYYDEEFEKYSGGRVDGRMAQDQREGEDYYVGPNEDGEEDEDDEAFEEREAAALDVLRRREEMGEEAGRRDMIAREKRAMYGDNWEAEERRLKELSADDPEFLERMRNGGIEGMGIAAGNRYTRRVNVATEENPDYETEKTEAERQWELREFGEERKDDEELRVESMMSRGRVGGKNGYSPVVSRDSLGAADSYDRVAADRGGVVGSERARQQGSNLSLDKRLSPQRGASGSVRFNKEVTTPNSQTKATTFENRFGAGGPASAQAEIGSSEPPRAHQRSLQEQHDAFVLDQDLKKSSLSLNQARQGLSLADEVKRAQQRPRIHPFNDRSSNKGSRHCRDMRIEETLNAGRAGNSAAAAFRHSDFDGMLHGNELERSGGSTKFYEDRARDYADEMDPYRGRRDRLSLRGLPDKKKMNEHFEHQKLSDVGPEGLETGSRFDGFKYAKPMLPAERAARQTDLSTGKNPLIVHTLHDLGKSAAIAEEIYLERLRVKDKAVEARYRKAMAASDVKKEGCERLRDGDFAQGEDERWSNFRKNSKEARDGSQAVLMKISEFNLHNTPDRCMKRSESARPHLGGRQAGSGGQKDNGFGRMFHIDDYGNPKPYGHFYQKAATPKPAGDAVTFDADLKSGLKFWPDAQYLGGLKRPGSGIELAGDKEAFKREQELLSVQKDRNRQRQQTGAVADMRKAHQDKAGEIHANSKFTAGNSQRSQSLVNFDRSWHKAKARDRKLLDMHGECEPFFAERDNGKSLGAPNMYASVKQLSHDEFGVTRFAEEGRADMKDLRSSGAMEKAESETSLRTQTSTSQVKGTWSLHAQRVAKREEEERRLGHGNVNETFLTTKSMEDKRLVTARYGKEAFRSLV